MSPKRKASINEFEHYAPSAADTRRAEHRLEEENGNAFPFDKEFDPSLGGDSNDALGVVETIQAQRIYPDPLQPRPSPLPYAIRVKFRRGEIDAFQAAREWLMQADKDAIIRHDISRYLSMGENMAANGQINPITGRWEQAVMRGKEKRVFRIETGEQRFWCAVLYHVQQGRDPADLSLRASETPAAIIPTETARVRRQISENRKNMQLTEVLQAREIARLLLVALEARGSQHPTFNEEDEYDYFRALLRREGNIPSAIWNEVQAEFGLSQHRMRQSLKILQFPSDLLDLAHRARLSYRELNAILGQPASTWKQAMGQAARRTIEMESGEEEEPAPGPASGTAPLADSPARQTVDPVELAARSMRRFYRSTLQGLQSEPLFLEQVADHLVTSSNSEDLGLLLEDLVNAMRVRAK